MDLEESDWTGLQPMVNTYNVHTIYPIKQKLDTMNEHLQMDQPIVNTYNLQ